MGNETISKNQKSTSQARTNTPPSQVNQAIRNNQAQRAFGQNTFEQTPPQLMPSPERPSLQSLMQRARIAPHTLTRQNVLQLHRAIGNHGVMQLVQSGAPIQREATTEEEEPLQGKFAGSIQREAAPEEEEPVQGKFAEPVQRETIPEEEEPVQGKLAGPVQREAIPEEEEPVQGKFAEPVQREAALEEEEPVQGKFAEPVQREANPEEEEPVQGKFAEPVQREAVPEEEEPVQGKFAEPVQREAVLEEEEPVQGKLAGPVQREAALEEEEPVQGKFAEPVQREAIPEEEEPVQGKFAKPDTQSSVRAGFKPAHLQGGLPAPLKMGLENLSGMSLDHVRVHYNSPKPAQLNAHAYTQGSDIHVAPGQEKHLPHEGWHVVQQTQGRVKPTMQMAGAQINDDKSLEREADVMGGRAVSKGKNIGKAIGEGKYNKGKIFTPNVLSYVKLNMVQRMDENDDFKDPKKVGPKKGIDIVGAPRRRQKMGAILRAKRRKVMLSNSRNSQVTELNDPFHEEDNHNGAQEEYISFDDFISNKIDGITLHNIFRGLATQYGYPNPSDAAYNNWRESNILTIEAFKNLLREDNRPPLQMARVAGATSYQEEYKTNNFGLFKKIKYILGDDGNINFSGPSSYSQWEDPVKNKTLVELSDGSKNKEYGIMHSGKKVKLADANRSQHFSIANRIKNINGSGSPDTWTWHHLSEKYKMVLVDRTVHSKHGHNGGIYIWKK